MKRIILLFTVFVCIFLLCACSKDEKTRPGSAKEDKELYTDEMVEGEHINVNIPEDNGFDIYKVPLGIDAGYRYGPSFIVYEDGSIDAWFASGGSSVEQWDWIVYRHYDGEFWSEEKCVLQPTPNALDHYSCCDPGVIYLNGYYYLAYTSTLNSNQADNNLFVARSKNPDGPYEKWNGGGWGGYDPKPIVTFNEDQSLWGIGEASFVELDDKLYIYYTCNGSSGHNTMLATADANDENWPATMKSEGVVLKNSSCDAIDVKYADKYQRFLAVASDERLTENSYLTFFESKDGINFIEVDALKKNVYEFCHNPGMSGSENGHIVEGRRTFVAYAYGPQWGVWNTRFQDIELSFVSNVSLIEKSSDNLKVYNMARDSQSSDSLDFVGISAQTSCVIRVPFSQKQVVLDLLACNRKHDRWKDLTLYRDKVSLYGYDESIIEQMGDALRFRIRGVGETMVTCEYQGHLTYVYICVYEDSASGIPVSLEPLFSDTLKIDYNFDLKFDPQIKSKLNYDDKSWKMVWDPNTEDIRYEYDSTALTVDASGHIKGKISGRHTVKVFCGELSYELYVDVIMPELDDLTFEQNSLAYSVITETNNTELKAAEDDILYCKVIDSIDPYIKLDLSPANMHATDYGTLKLCYMIPKSNSLDSYNAQLFFRCEKERLCEDVSQRISLVADGEFHTLSFKLDDKKYWHGIISDIRIDYFDSCVKGDEFYIRSVELE